MRVNKNHIVTKKISKSEIDFDFDGSPFWDEKCFDYDGQCFEDLRDDYGDIVFDFPTEFRIVLSDDDYDYVEDTDLIEKLRAQHPIDPL